MNFIDLKKEIRKLYAPAFALDAIISHNAHRYLELIFRILAIFLFTFSMVLYMAEVAVTDTGINAFTPQIFGATAIVFVIWTFLFVFKTFYYSYYYREVSKDEFYIDFHLAKSINAIKNVDVVKGFFRQELGQLILLRCGTSPTQLNKFLSGQNFVLDEKSFICKTEDKTVTLKSFVLSLLEQSKPLEDFLFSVGIQKKELSGVCEWISEMNENSDATARWWSLENLNRIPSIGQNWSYGQIYTLQKYSRPLISGLSRHYRVHSSYGVKELVELEAVLSRTRDANVLLVGDDEAGRLQIVSHLAQSIVEGTVVGRLKNKRVIFLNNEELASRNGNKSAFESECIRLLMEAISAGNIILVIDDIAGLISSSGAFGVDLPGLFEPYLSSQNLQIIALNSLSSFHQVIEKNSILSQHFETILIKAIDDTNTIRVLENELVRFERNGLFFTYPALEEISQGAVRYFPQGAMPDKAIDLLLEIAPKLLSKGKAFVEKADVLELIQTKTGIPVGEVSSVEKDKLLHLEDILHTHIVGQDEAIRTISSSVRRARSGITNPNRPMGSFLFLGPTGVGKTETTKALAEVFFGEDAKILRLDMSEYSSFDAVSKLIGSFESKHSGVLSSMLREHQYGVLLLDEFEKATKEVMNLFLQILDEGFFSDAEGQKVGARNLIIIATSNAGSELIWETMQKGEDLQKEKDSIVDNIIKEGIFKPELLNRFDGVVLFHPLSEEHLRKIAELMLDRLHARLAEQGINLKVNKELINFVVNFGTDPKFGARPMNRAIQEKVEEAVAKKILSNSIPKGSVVELTHDELV